MYFGARPLVYNHHQHVVLNVARQNPQLGPIAIGDVLVYGHTVVCHGHAIPVDRKPSVKRPRLRLYQVVMSGAAFRYCHLYVMVLRVDDVSHNDSSDVMRGGCVR